MLLYFSVKPQEFKCDFHLAVKVSPATDQGELFTERIPKEAAVPGGRCVGCPQGAGNESPAGSGWGGFSGQGLAAVGRSTAGGINTDLQSLRKHCWAEHGAGVVWVVS